MRRWCPLTGTLMETRGACRARASALADRASGRSRETIAAGCRIWTEAFLVAKIFLRRLSAKSSRVLGFGRGHQVETSGNRPPGVGCEQRFHHGYGGETVGHRMVQPDE